MKKNKQITIIEGLDGTGKSTYAKYLAKTNNIKECLIYHETAETSLKKKDIIKRYKNNLIFDRSFLGEFVWAEMFKRKQRISFNKIIKIMKKLMKQGYEFKIYLKMLSLNAIEKNIKARNEVLNYDLHRAYINYLLVLEHVKKRLNIDYEVIKEVKYGKGDSK